MDTLVLSHVYLWNITHKLLEFAILDAEIVINGNEFLVDVHQLALARTRAIDFDVEVIDLILQGLDDDFIWFESLLYPLIFFLVFYRFIEYWKFCQNYCFNVLETLKKTLLGFVLASHTSVYLLLEHLEVRLERLGCRAKKFNLF